MGLFNTIFQARYCDICGGELPLVGGKKLRDGTCCKNCMSWFSPYYDSKKTATVEETKYQVECRQKNMTLLSGFRATRAMGIRTKVIMDENSGHFLITPSADYKKENVDVIRCSDITGCSVDVVEKRKEIKYKDSNDEIKSFNPPCYAYSYDFFVEISVQVPYIDTIRLKINDEPVNNGQETLIKYDGGLLGRFADALLPAKSYNGMTSNVQEVKASASYQKCVQAAEEIRTALLKERDRYTARTAGKVTCPWCGSKVNYGEHGVCCRCGGVLDA